MKNILRKFFILVITLLVVVNVFAKPTPPPPNGKAAAAAGPPSPPGLPIDDNISVLLIMGTLLGIYMVYRYQLKTKAPIS